MMQMGAHFNDRTGRGFAGSSFAAPAHRVQVAARPLCISMNQPAHQLSLKNILIAGRT
jgi:hypothetical protein